MLKKISLVIFLYVLGTGILFCQQRKYSFETGKMGSPFRIIIAAEDTLGLHSVIKSGFDLAEELENQLSDYRENSDVSKINKKAGLGEFHAISPDFKEILLESIRAKKLTNGYLNVFSGYLVKEWRKTKVSRVLPDSVVLQKVSREIAGDCIEFSSDSMSVSLRSGYCQLDFGSIGKGFVAQKVLDFLVAKGFSNVLVDAGGKIVCTQTNNQSGTWKIGVELPMSYQIANKLLEVKNTSVSSSGKTYQTFTINNISYSHVLNPKTGWPFEHSKSATVVVSDGKVSDWLATAATMLDINELKEMLKEFKEVKILVWQNIELKLEVLFNQGIL